MSTGQTPAKTCAICGEDVSQKPRTKDPKGHYYCRECYDQARAKHQSHRHDDDHAPPRPSPKPVANSKPEPPPIPVDDDPLDPHINILDDLIAEPPPVMAPTAMAACPKCHTSLPAGAVICTNCGYNVQTHDTVGSTRVLKEPQQSTGGVIWPPIIGITSMIFGGCGVLLYGGSVLLQVIGAIAAGRLPIGPLAGGMLVVALAAWCLRDGWRILQRNSDGPKWIVGWAITKLVIYGACFGILLAVPVDQFTGTRSFTSQTGLRDLDASQLKLIIALLLGWYAFWPLTVLIFFSIPRIRSDIKQWD